MKHHRAYICHVYNLKKLCTSCDSFFTCVFCLFSLNTIHTNIKISKIQIWKDFILYSSLYSCFGYVTQTLMPQVSWTFIYYTTFSANIMIQGQQRLGKILSSFNLYRPSERILEPIILLCLNKMKHLFQM